MTVEISSSGMLGFSKHISKQGVYLFILSNSNSIFRKLERIDRSHSKVNPETAILNTATVMKRKHFSLGDKTVHVCVRHTMYLR